MAEHNTLSGSSLHEPKGIDSAGTSDAGKVLTPSSTSAGTGELRNLVESEIDTKIAYITARFDDVSTAGDIYIPMNFAGSIDYISSVIDGALGTGDVTLTCKINGTAITSGAITITQASSAAGDVDSATPTALNNITSGQYIQVTSDGASTNTVAAWLMFTITRD